MVYRNSHDFIRHGLSLKLTLFQAAQPAYICQCLCICADYKKKSTSTSTEARLAPGSSTDYSRDSVSQAPRSWKDLLSSENSSKGPFVRLCFDLLSYLFCLGHPNRIPDPPRHEKRYKPVILVCRQF